MQRNQGRGRGGGRGRGNHQDDRQTQISKTLSYLLRHGAQKEGVNIRVSLKTQLIQQLDGYVLIDDVLNWNKIQKMHATFDEIQHVVNTNEKKRFQLEQIEENGNTQWYIRAVQGHTIQDIDDDQLLEKIIDPTIYPVIIHGTYYQAWELIKNSGLKTMGRNHVHFAIGYPGEEGVISGMRATCQIMIEVDLKKAMDDGLVFYKSKNNVILSAGIDGIIQAKYFKRVIDAKTKQVIYQQQEEQFQQQFEEQKQVKFKGA